jgi:hypothetical protein
MVLVNKDDDDDKPVRTSSAPAGPGMQPGNRSSSFDETLRELARAAGNVLLTAVIRFSSSRAFTAAVRPSSGRRPFATRR